MELKVLSWGKTEEEIKGCYYKFESIIQYLYVLYFNEKGIFLKKYDKKFCEENIKISCIHYFALELSPFGLGIRFTSINFPNYFLLFNTTIIIKHTSPIIFLMSHFKHPNCFETDLVIYCETFMKYSQGMRLNGSHNYLEQRAIPLVSNLYSISGTCHLLNSSKSPI